MLYVYDEDAYHHTSFRNPETLLVDPAFQAAEAESYWMEGVNDQIYQVPEFGPCEIAAMLSATPSFRAPAGGLLFLQFVVDAPCPRCDEITAAIVRVIGAHPERNFRWTQVTVPPSVGRLQTTTPSR